MILSFYPFVICKIPALKHNCETFMIIWLSVLSTPLSIKSALQPVQPIFP